MRVQFLALSLTLFIASCSFFEEKVSQRKQTEVAQKAPESELYEEEEGRQGQIRSLERQLNTKREKEHYSKLLPWFRNDKEKLQYLHLPNIKEKQKWALDKGIWTRAKKPSRDMKEIMDGGDIAIGMPMDFVLKSWGEPLQREVSGNPLFKNEKWKYSRSLPSAAGYKQERRTVYFEGGKVVGWETE